MISASEAERIWLYFSGAFDGKEIPALTAQYRAWSKTRPLEGLRILDATPLFLNTCVKHAALIAGGADLTAAYSDLVPYDPKVVELLEKQGVRTVRNAYDGTDAGYDVILDCGGVHCGMTSTYGAVELTRSGVPRYECRAGRNVFLADSGVIKRIETSLGTGESCLRALTHLGYGPFPGKNVLILGGGKVGGGIAAYFRRAGALVSVADDPASVPGAIPFRSRPAMTEAVRSADFIVTATGRANAHAELADELTACRAVLVNMGVEDEFGPDVPESCVLNRKAPLNFILDEPTRTRYIDPTMALDNEGVLILKNAAPGTGLIVPDAALEKRILDDVRRGGVIGAELEMILKGNGMP